MDSKNKNYSNTMKREYLIFGYIRNIEKILSLSYEFPEGVVHIIISHYPVSDFKFHDKKLRGITVSEDGLTLNSKDVSHTIRFGDFLHKKDNIIFEVVFELKQISAPSAGIGFMTPEYDETRTVLYAYNMGHNHSCCVTGNGYFVDTPEDFISNYEHGTYSVLALWQTGDKLHVEIDMIEQKGRMWNDDDTEKTNMFEVGLPESAAIMVDVAATLEIIAIYQHFRYKK